ncbi:hypothetical protein DPMN_074814 [Dreissena polymorpha]|uniref:Uncharacterized protein n=1 Tax=Dreissena polymorpha TaxID=45954 RepID=A0A9D3YG16_DREPO|nr:hypothetical protein DPMN_074814 [Dreissena polymorpha]
MTPKKTDVILSTDMYKLGSVKAIERKRRVCGEKLLVKGKTPNKRQTGRVCSQMTRTSNNL